MIVVLASANPDKAVEISEILAASASGIELRPRPADLPEIEETGATLEDNARLKAAAVADASGLPAIADDTGLEVEALDGAPGVLSSRYAGERASYEENVAKLLGSMIGISERRARFRTVAILRWPDGRELVAEGVVEGTIADEARGSAGFGYDPVFVADEGGGRTFAELGPEAKHRMSHRGRAFRALAAQLSAAGSPPA